MENYAVLSSSGKFTIFSFGDAVIRFQTSSQLEQYTKVVEWDKGYLVVMAKYKNQKKEGYIDLVPILDNLYMNTDKFVNSIGEVRIQYS